jgi:hypothetical protein
MTKAILVERLHLKCDAPACDYEEDTPLSADPTSYINKPCPKCGANLLTREDCDAYLKAYATIEAINAILEPILPESVPTDKQKTVAINPRANSVKIEWP